MEYSIWLKVKSCSFQLHFILPAQLTPSPVYPGLQVHVKECLVLVQYASSWQLCSPVLHSSTNQQVKVSYKNFLDLNVFSCKKKQLISWSLDLNSLRKRWYQYSKQKNVAFKGLSLYCVAGLRGCYTSEIWPLVISISRAFGLPQSARDNFSCHEWYCFFFAYALKV